MIEKAAGNQLVFNTWAQPLNKAGKTYIKLYSSSITFDIGCFNLNWTGNFLYVPKKN